MNKKEKRIQSIKAYLVADEGRPRGEERQALLDELHKLEVAVQKSKQ